MKKPQVYVAGCYTAHTDDAILDNVADALRAGLQLARHGYWPVIPHTALGHRIEWAEAMEQCRSMVASMDPRRGDFLCLLPGWQLSLGACDERELALSLGIPVRTLAEVTK